MAYVKAVPYRARIPGDEQRPLVAADLENFGTILCLLDSGADVTTMPMAIGEKAGINVKKTGQRTTSECCHGHSSESYIVPLKLNIFGENFILPVNFVKDGGEPALLGRREFFDKFEILFDEKNTRVILKRN